MPLQPGERFGRYEISALIGKGGMGEVYRAQDTVLHRRVALKVLHPAPSLSPLAGSGSGPGSNPTDGAARILREARAAAGIEHPNAIAIYDVGEVEGVPFLAMEFVSGRSLRDYVGDGSVSLPRRVRWLVEIAGALGAAHALGLVHRDIKPENIMIRADGAVKVLDFGIARRATSKIDGAAPADLPALGTFTAEGVVVGTPFYMAPEQMRGEPLDGRADQFAWGVLAYELVTGKLPWDRDAGGLQLVAQILSREVEPLVTRNPEVPEAVDAAVQRALSKSAAARFAQMAEAALALEPYAAPPGLTTGQLPARRTSTPAGPDVALAPTEAIPSGAPAKNAISTRTQLATPMPPRTKPPPGSLKERWGARAGVAAAVLGIGAGAFWLSSRHAAKPEPPRDAAPAVMAESEMSPNAEATAAYRAGMQALRDGSREIAERHLTRAIELDPLFAAARLRRATILYSEPEDHASEDLQTARNARGSLGAHDRVVLDAMEPWTHVPQDLAESARRFEAALKAEPANVDYAMLLGWTLSLLGEEARAAAVFGTVIERDPSLPIARYMRGLTRSAQDDVGGALAEYEACLAVSPGATSCLQDSAALQAYQGKCDDMVRTLRRLTASSPADHRPYEMLAGALLATGASIGAVEAVLAQAWERVPAGDRRMREILDRVALANWTGDFDKAAQLDRDFEGLFSASPVEMLHFIPAYDRMLLNLETGNHAEVVRLADDYLQRRAAWQGNDFTQSPAIYVAVAKRDAGGLTWPEFEHVRDAWLADEPEGGTPFDGQKWAVAYAMPTRTKDDAIAALARQPEGPVTHPLSLQVAEDSEPVGRTYLLAGKLDEAVSYLRRASASCAALQLWAPAFSTWATAELGAALEARGDTAGACRAYRQVLARWGNAKPPSRTASRAGVRAAALKCPERAPLAQ